MTKLLLCLSLFIFSAGLSFSQEPSRGLKGTTDKTDSIGTTYALVVGVSSYANINPLLYADDDAYLFSEYLADEKICEKKNIYRLIDSAATTANFYRELTRLKNKVARNDRVFLYFGGHGDVENDLESGFLLTYNCEANNYPATAIDISMLEKYVNFFVNKNVNVVLITDACRAGTLSGGLAGPSRTMGSLDKAFQKCIKILSCQPNQLSLEKDYPGGGHGVFTYHLVDGLMGMADMDGDSSVSVREINFYLDKVRTETNKQQAPKVDGDPEKNIVKFDVAKKNALLVKKQGAGDQSLVAQKEIKRGEDSSWLKNSYYQDFSKHIINQRFIEPAKNNAQFEIAEAEKNKQAPQLIAEMKLQLAAILEDEAQKRVNKYLRGEFENNTGFVLADLKKVTGYFGVIETLISKNDFRFNELAVKKIFFESLLLLKTPNNTTSLKPALSELEKANKSMPNQAWVLNLLGSFYRELKKYPEAIVVFKKAASLAPNWFYPWNNLGIVYREMEKYEEAEIHYKKAIQIDSAKINPYHNLAMLYAHYIKNAELAEQYYKQAIQLDSLAVDSWYNLGYLYAYSANKPAEAEFAFKKSIQIDSNSLYAWWNLGYLYATNASLKNTATAEKAYERASRIDPQNAGPWYYLGLLYDAEEKSQPAETAYKKAIQLDSSYGYAWYKLYNLYIKLDRKEEAKDIYIKAYKVVPNFNGYFVPVNRPKERYWSY